MLYLLTIFLSAALLFMVQPIIAKFILPWFGGGASVWTTCMLFFQVFLLAGYCYAHLLSRIGRTKVQALIHGVVVLVSLIAIPLSITSDNLVIDASSPEPKILMLLLLSIGLPYFVLSSTGPLLQRWFSYRYPDKTPYKLYSLSNVGSLLGLISYPFLIEPNMMQSNQMLMWSIGYGSYVIALLAITWLFSRNAFTNQQQAKHTKINYRLLGCWVGLSMLGVILLLAITNAMSQNIASVPFLWLLPLTLYLVTFIVSFSGDKYYVRTHWALAFVFAVLASYLMYFFAGYFNIIAQVSLYSFILLASCMLCHGELARIKPDKEQLTLYFLAISFGGFVGGLTVSLIAPQIFSSFSEFPLAIYLLFLSLVLVLWRAMPKSKTLLIAAQKTTLLALMFALPASFIVIEQAFVKHDVVSSRNFYGQLSVKDIVQGRFNERRLVDGTTSHGTQSLSFKLKGQALSYYRVGTGVELAIKSQQKEGELNIGIIGLGAGTLSVYGRANDNFYYYELNPQVKKYALQYFSYLSDSLASNEIVLGDGRLTLQNKLQSHGSMAFDILVVDAFSSDAIPAHLLTREALALYRQHLRPSGIIAMHISNNHLDLTPLLRGLADDSNMAAALYLKKGDKVDSNIAQWVLLANNKDVLQLDSLRNNAVSWPKNSGEQVVWTDDFSNLLSVIKY